MPAHAQHQEKGKCCLEKTVSATENEYDISMEITSGAVGLRRGQEGAPRLGSSLNDSQTFSSQHQSLTCPNALPLTQ